MRQQRNGARELGLVVAVLAVSAHFVDGMPLWVATVLIVAATVSGVSHLLGEWRPWRIAPERLVLPALAAFSVVGIAHVFAPVPWLAFVFVGTWLLVAWVVELETADSPAQPAPVAASDDVSTEAAASTYSEIPGEGHGLTEAGASESLADNHGRPFSVRVGALGIAFLAFAAVGGFVPGGLAGDGKTLTAPALVATIALDVLIGGLAGYRIAALLPHSRREGLVAFYQYALAAGHIGGFLRVLALPRLFGPALLTLLLYLVTGFRESPTPIRQSRRLLEESGLLVLAGAAAVFWGLLAK
ncbi:MAG TPA: hypothetical protein VF361_07145 [Candidatus Limnocylindrales bacterium]